MVPWVVLRLLAVLLAPRVPVGRILLLLMLPWVLPFLVAWIVEVILAPAPTLLVLLLVRVGPGEAPRPPSTKLLRQNPFVDVLVRRLPVPARPLVVPLPRAIRPLRLVPPR